ncbi:MAG: ribosomal-processing cysteine protease Prp [Acholeplasmatales bacterium]|jgi:uncharacterized protein YsxB (DUF464 family)|nr:ribosomal-processing cysteine protease Prp [Acholeplasmatales bacterium]
MIKYSYNNLNTISNLEVLGHANMAKYGTDIVCSSVSTLIISSINLIERLQLKDFLKLELTEGIFRLQVLKANSLLNTILINLVESLNDLNDQFPQYIKKEKKTC